MRICGLAVPFETLHVPSLKKGVEVERKKETHNSKKSNNVKEKPKTVIKKLVSELGMEARALAYQKWPKLSRTMDQRSYQSFKVERNFLYDMG